MLEALRAPQVDERLLAGCSEILHAMLASGFYHYQDGEAVLLAFLQCVERTRPRRLQVRDTVRQIAAYVQNAAVWDAAMLHEASTLADSIMGSDHWPIEDKHEQTATEPGEPSAAERTLAP